METVTVTILARGHKNIQANHKTALEITKETTLTKRGDCIIAVEATKGTADLPLEFREAAKRKDAHITITIEAGELKEVIRAKGSPRLQFTHPTDLVVRKSNYVCGRTLAIGANKAASGLSRKFVERIQDSSQAIGITVVAGSY